MCFLVSASDSNNCEFSFPSPLPFTFSSRHLEMFPIIGSHKQRHEVQAWEMFRKHLPASYFFYSWRAPWSLAHSTRNSHYCHLLNSSQRGCSVSSVDLLADLFPSSIKHISFLLCYISLSLTVKASGLW